MSLNIFTGKVDGKSFIAAQSHISSEQYRAGMVVDTLTTLPGSRVPKFSKSGWLIRTIAPDLSLEYAETLIERTCGEIVKVGEVNRDDVAKFIGPKMLDKALNPHHLEPEISE